MFWQAWSPYSRLFTFVCSFILTFIIGYVVLCNFCISCGVGLVNLMICTSVLLCSYNMNTTNGF